MVIQDGAKKMGGKFCLATFQNFVFLIVGVSQLGQLSLAGSA